MKKIALLLALFAIGLQALMAQTKDISGRVTSAEDGEVIPGVSVSVKGTTLGTITDMNGVFKLKAPQESKALLFSFVGMKTLEVAIGNQTNFNVKMNSESISVDEVVVTALGITREKKSLGFSVQEAKGEEVTKGGQMNLTSSLSGKFAGVQVNQFGGTVGASSRITIRGNSSFRSDQQPLIVVDGVPISNDTKRSGDNTYSGVDYGSGLNDINPEDIESVTVLKGGSAAIYGMLAGSGVILITTKSGKGKEGVTVSYDGNFTVDRISTLPKLQNQYGQGYGGDEYHWKADGGTLSYQDYAEQNAFTWVDGSNGVNDFYDESWGPRLDVGLKLKQFDSPVVSGQRQATDWVSRPDNVKDFFQTGFSENHTVSVQSQSAKSNTRFSVSYRDQSGTVPNTDQKRYSGQFNTEMKLNKVVSFDVSANYTRTQSDNLLGQGYGGNNPINSLTVWSGRQINMQSLKENWNQKDATGEYTFYNWNMNYHMNPYFTVNQNTNSLRRDRFFTKSSVFVQPLSYLKFEGRVGFDYYNMKSFERHYKDYSDYPDGGFDQRTYNNSEINLDFIASFNKVFGDLNVAVVAGANYRDVNYDYDRTGASKLTVNGVYTLSNKVGDAIAEMDHSRLRSNSVYSTGSLGWKNQVYVDLSARNDWSSTINESFFYPSASLSWLPTESFEGIKGNVLSFLKLRGGWAEIGSATSPYRNRAYYYAETSSFKGIAQMYKSFTYPNAGLRPESVKTWEVGMETGLFNERIHLDFAYYRKMTEDQIMNVSTSNVVGFSAMVLNAGKIRSKGVEIQLRGDILKKKDGFNWSSTLNFTKDNSEVLELAPDFPSLKSYQLGWTWGIANQAIAGEPWGVLVGTGYARTEDGAIKVNKRGLITTAASQKIGYVAPDFLTGLRNDFSYKNLSFGIFFDLRIGGDIWSQSMSHSYTAGTALETVKNSVRERAIVAGKDVMTNERFVMQDANGNWVPNTIETDAQTWFESGGVAEMYVFDGSFLKLREAYVTYNLPKSLLSRTNFLSKATVSLVGSNLALLWVHDSNTLRLDPEAGGVSSDTRGVGYEQASVPSSRSFGLKLNLTF
jgi:TonB-linked SusC/RagA family outer membrane protein